MLHTHYIRFNSVPKQKKVIDTLGGIYFNEESANNQKKLSKMIKSSSKNEGK